MQNNFTGRKAAYVASEGRASPRAGADQIAFFGLGVVFSVDTKEVGLALGAAFTSRHRYSWRLEWHRKRRPLADLADSLLRHFKWHDLADLPDVLRVPATVLMQRIQEGQSACMLFKREGFDRLAKARLEGIEYGDRKMTIGEWCAFLGVRYTTMCARLSNPTMSMDKVMSSERVLGGRQRNQLMKPEIRTILDARGISYQTFYSRIQAGWREERACSTPPRRYHQKGVPLELQAQAPAGLRMLSAPLREVLKRDMELAPEVGTGHIPASQDDMKAMLAGIFDTNQGAQA